jgi:hypothetical protein
MKKPSVPAAMSCLGAALLRQPVICCSHEFMVDVEGQAGHLQGIILNNQASFTVAWENTWFQDL